MKDDGSAGPPVQGRLERLGETRTVVEDVVTSLDVYSDSLTLRQARALFFQRSNLPPDGGYSARWVRIEAKPFPFFFPNTASRIRSVRIHDIHHIATAYRTDWPGEIEIAAWEIGGSCADHPAAWILNASTMAVGLIMAPRRMWKAFLLGRHSENLYRTDFEELALDGLTVENLRHRLRLDSPPPTPGASDVALFLLWCALVFAPAATAVAVLGLIVWRVLIR